MDKPNKGNTIKIKLNGENTKFEEEASKMEPEVSSNTATKVIKINPAPTESDSYLETAASQESVDESFDWIIPESSDTDLMEYKIATTTNTKKKGPKMNTSISSNSMKKNGRPLGSIFVSATFAILIGLTIGIFMLKMVTEPSKKVATEPAVVEETGGTETTTTTTGKTTTAAIEQITAYVIQGGVFSSKDGAKATADQITEKGIPSKLVEMSGKQYLFLGVADTIDMAKTLGNQYKENGISEVFAKPLLVDEKKVADVSEKEKAFLEGAPTIYQALSIVTSSAMVTKSIPEESAKTLTALSEQLKVSGLKNENVKKLHAELAGADVKIKDFQKSKDEKSLSAAQQHLLNFLSVYYSM
ncbi:SPOR domain-containing protein [Neobacillus sp. PS2-9]|uniref:SPOR domain-containing protein n=1 Tax=Neobacillus sp. PS2-9 TaxID=3070676 RepID=UPI0027E17446|nr:SPOR domain-containing protein [Neobacillus sp. PS2-9]WML59576.1 SPOR domain-containing protein [Neobacillus sp. PS2-9]